MQTTTTAETVQTIGELCVAADRACVDGDIATLAGIVRQLAVFAGEPLHCELDALATLCGHDETSAIAAWARVKNRVYRNPS
jgi:hypothetical protein